MVPCVTRRDDAAALADELLTNIELTQLEPIEVARKASRLARLLDGFDALEWLTYEVSGYPREGLPAPAWNAAKKSGRVSLNEEKGVETANANSLAALKAQIDVTLAQSSVAGQNSAPWERANVRREVGQLQRMLDNVVGSIYLWVQRRHYELKFGAAVETAFHVVRSHVDSRISRVAPDAVK